MPDNDFSTPTQLETQRAMAKALLEESMKTPEGHSGHFTAVSPLAPFAQMAEALSGRLQQNRATTLEKQNVGLFRGEPAGGEYTPPSTSEAEPDEDQPKQASAAGGDNIIEAVMKPMIAQRESANSKDPYRAKGPVVRTASGPDQAWGKYQVMGNNIPGWTQAALGKPMTPQEFLADEKAQETVASHKLGQYLAQTGNPRDAASMWFSGRPLAQAQNLRAHDLSGKPIGISGAQYASAFPATMPGAAPGAAQSPQGGSALAFNGAPAQSPIQRPDSPQAMSAALAPSEAATGGPAPAAEGAEAPVKMAGGPAARPSGTSPGMPQVGIPQITPPRRIVTRQQANAAVAILGQDPNNVAAKETYAAYMMQNQPIEGKGPYDSTILMNPHDPGGSQPVVVPGAGHWGEKSIGPIKYPIWQGVAPPGSNVGPPSMTTLEPDGGLPAPSGPAAPPGPPPPSLIPGGKTPVPSDDKRSEAEPEAEAPKTKLASLETGAMSDAGPALATKPPAVAVAQPVVPETGPAEAAGKVAQVSPRDAATLDYLKNYDAEKAALTDLKKKDVETYNKNLSNYRDAETSAYASTPQLKILQNIINQAETIQGPLADPKIGMATLYAALGDKASMKMLDFNGAMDKVVNSSIMKEMHSQLAGWAGQVRNSEILMLTKAMASKHNTLAANRAIVDIYMNYAEQAKHLGEIARGYSEGWRYDEKGQPHWVGSNVDRPTATGMDQAIKTYLRNNPLYTDEQIFGKGGDKDHPTGGFMKIFQDDEQYKAHTGVRGSATTGYTRPPPSQEQLNKAILRKQQQQSIGGT